MKDETMTAEFQHKMDDFIHQNLTMCVSSLIQTLAGMAEEEALSEWSDDLYGAYESEPDYREAAENEGWKRAINGRFFKPDGTKRFFLAVNLHERGCLHVSVHTADEPGQGSNAPEVWEYNGPADAAANLDGSEALDITETDEITAYLIGSGIIPEKSEIFDDEDCDFEITDADSWQELCEDESIDTDGYRSEVYEHWVVSDWFAGKLREHGNKIIDDICGVGPIWCRTCTGQSISMDSTPIAIYRELQAELNE